jgi:hypothetical protein
MAQNYPVFPGTDGFFYTLIITRKKDWLVVCSEPSRAVCFKINDKVITNGKGYFDAGKKGIIKEISPLHEFFDGDLPIRPGILCRHPNNPEDTFWADLHELDLAVY